MSKHLQKEKHLTTFIMLYEATMEMDLKEARLSRVQVTCFIA